MEEAYIEEEVQVEEKEEELTRWGYKKKIRRIEVKCSYNCKRYGHKKAKCWLRSKETNFLEHTEVSNLFMVKNETNISQECLWIVDNGCSNHMSGDRSLFYNLLELEVSL